MLLSFWAGHVTVLTNDTWKFAQKEESGAAFKMTLMSS